MQCHLSLRQCSYPVLDIRVWAHLARLQRHRCFHVRSLGNSEMELGIILFALGPEGACCLEERVQPCRLTLNAVTLYLVGPGLGATTDGDKRTSWEI